MLSFASIAEAAPAGGTELGEVLVASVVGFAAVAAVIVIGVAHRRRGVLSPLATLSERRSGLPAWAALPNAVAGISLVVAVWGYYWDVSWHIDRGRDPGAFANPAHWFIIAGLDGIAFAGILSLILGDDRSRTSVRITDRWSVPVGGVLLSICGLVALAGFPLDDIWHRLFGQDVTAWGPTHIQMIFGASLATISVWALLVEGRRAAAEAGTMTERIQRSLDAGEIALAGAFLIGLSTLQVEFDFGVPQFRLLFHPVLLALAAAVGLVAARLRLGRGGALLAAGFFLGARVLLAVGIAAAGRDWLRFPLYLAEAVAVEAVASLAPRLRGRQVTFGVTAGVAAAVAGLVAEWGWSDAFMPIPWSTELLPSVVPLVVVAGAAGGALGGLIGRAFTDDVRERQPIPPWVPGVAWTGAALCLLVPLPIGHHDGWRADIHYTAAGNDRYGVPLAFADVDLQPADAADNAEWFHVLAWQGASQTQDGGYALVDLVRRPDGGWRTKSPVPVGGSYKTVLRLHAGGSMQDIPIYLPADAAIPADASPAVDGLKSFEREKSILQREAKTDNVWLERGAYVALLGVAVLWFASMSWGLARLGGTVPACPPSSSTESRKRQLSGTFSVPT